MRIYNGKKSKLDLPLSGTTRITIEPYSASGDVLVSTDFLSLLVTSYDYSELALIVRGRHELNLCAQVPSVAGFLVETLDDAIARFAPKEEVAKKTVIEVVKETVDEVKEAAEEVVDEVKTETKKVVEKVKLKTKKAVETLSEEEAKIDEDMATGTPIVSE